jgi:hypothetical protein
MEAIEARVAANLRVANPDTAKEQPKKGWGFGI